MAINNLRREYLVDMQRRRGLTDMDIALKTGTTPDYYRKIVSGTRQPDIALSWIVKLSDALECTIDLFVRYEQIYQQAKIDQYDGGPI